MRRSFASAKQHMLKLLAALSGITLLLGSPYTVEAILPAASEHQIKAAYLYNFTKFISWPSEAFKDAHSTLNLCVSEEEQFKTIFNTVNGQTTGNRNIQVLTAGKPDEISSCHILLVGSNNKSTMTRFIFSAKGKPVLTVGEQEDFTANGGMIRFFIENNRVLFEINREALAKAGLEASSRILSVSRKQR